MDLSLLYNKALGEKNNGNLKEAEIIFNKILIFLPEDPKTLLNLALIYVQFNQLDRSKALLKKLIKIDQFNIDAYINLGNIFIIKKNYLEAIKIFLKVQKLDNTNKTVVNNLAFLYNEIEDYDKAYAIINQSLLQDDNNFFILNILGSILFKKEKIDESIKSYKKSIESNSMYINSYIDLFSVLEKTNKIDILGLYLKKALKSFSKDHRILIFQSMYLLRIKKFKDSIDILLDNKILKKIKKQDSFLIKYYDILGKVYDNLNDSSLSFKYFLKRNKIIEKDIANKKFDKKILIEVIQTYKKYFTSKIKYSKKIPKDDIFFKEPIFLVGFPRSGTTLLDTILATNDQTIVFEEKPMILKIRDIFFNSNQNKINALDNISLDDIYKLRKKYKELTSRNNNTLIKNRIIIDKQPLNLIEIGFINKIFPKSKIILMLRHPLDVILSCFMTNFKINEAMSNFYTIKDSAIFYDKVFSLWEIYEKNLNLNYHVIKYENLILNFDYTVNNLLNFLNLKWQKNMKNFNQTALSSNKINSASYYQVIEPLYERSLYKWKRFNEIREVYPIVEKWINKYNYS